jgi:hypothetical protein
MYVFHCLHFFQRLYQSLSPCVTVHNIMWMFIVTMHEWIIPSIKFCNMLVLCHPELLATCPTCKLRDHTLLPVCGCWLKIFAATLHICRLSPSEYWGLAIQGYRAPMWHGSVLSVRRVGVHKLYVLCHLGDEICTLAPNICGSLV